jgi:hypothetical protein
MPRRIAILIPVLKLVMNALTEARHEFWRAHQRLEEARDPRSWEELATLPAKDPWSLPEDAWIMPFGNGGLVTYVIDGDSIEIIGVVLP